MVGHLLLVALGQVVRFVSGLYVELVVRQGVSAVPGPGASAELVGFHLSVVLCLMGAGDRDVTRCMRDCGPEGDGGFSPASLASLVLR